MTIALPFLVANVLGTAVVALFERRPRLRLAPVVIRRTARPPR